MEGYHTGSESIDNQVVCRKKSPTIYLQILKQQQQRLKSTQSFSLQFISWCFQVPSVTGNEGGWSEKAIRALAEPDSAASASFFPRKLLSIDTAAEDSLTTPISVSKPASRLSRRMLLEDSAAAAASGGGKRREKGLFAGEKNDFEEEEEQAWEWILTGDGFPGRWDSVSPQLIDCTK